MYFGKEPYGLETHIKEHGSGIGLYRGKDFGQPRSLRDGDVLANGLILSSNPEDAGNGSVALNFTDGSKRIVPARVPVSLRSEKPIVLPMDLIIGSILETGDVVLSKPFLLSKRDVLYKPGRQEVAMVLTGGFHGHAVDVPNDITVAVTPDIYPPPSDTAFGKFIIEKVVSMDESAHRKLQNLGQLTFEIS